ncbi:MAG: hypothetical protein MZW92_38105 [Comamonadaceae bacterium]|nr:hypothetical protein [Comamonadaceae bacterium]
MSPDEGDNWAPIARHLPPHPVGRGGDGDAMIVVIPGPLHSYTQGRSRTECEAASLARASGHARRALSQACAFGMVDEQDRIRPHIRIYADGASRNLAGGASRCPARSPDRRRSQRRLRCRPARGRRSPTPAGRCLLSARRSSGAGRWP